VSVILGIGTDIVEIARIKKSLTNPSFLKRCYTQREVDYCLPKGAGSFAGLFAAKESVAKALGTGFTGFLPADVEICHDEAGRPAVQLSSRVKMPQNSYIALSIAHEKNYATATAIIFQKE